MTSTTDARSTRPLTVIALLLAGGWILTGALFKLLQGSPGLLPAFMKEWGLPLEQVYPTVIGIEFAVVAIAWLRPRPGWILLALQYLAFFGVLGVQIARGEESCGCMGGSVKLAPVVMLAIDGTLFGLLLASRPWSGLGFSGLPKPLVGIAAAALVVLPWFGERGQEVDDTTLALLKAKAQQAKTQQAQPPAAAEPVIHDHPLTDETVGSEVPGGAVSPALEAPGEGEAPTTEPDVVATEVAPEPPAPDPEVESTDSAGWTVFYPDRWVGQDLFSIPLANYLLEDELALMPDSGLIVFYRQQCDHCRDHLLELANVELGQRRIGLVRVPEPSDTPDNSLIVVKPEGPHVSEATLIEGIEYVLNTPAEIEVEGFVVTAAREGIQ
ncbi:MAG: MauE/DoxX family redox-associated membrane protein [Planctomycetota bacterium]